VGKTREALNIYVLIAPLWREKKNFLLKNMPKKMYPRSFTSRKKYASGQPSGTSPFKRKGLNVRGGYATSMPAPRKTKKEAASMPMSGIADMFMKSAKERGAAMATDAAEKAANAALEMAADAASAAATKGVKAAKSYVKTKAGSGAKSVKGPTKVFTEDPTMSSTEISVGVRRINNAIVPDKDFRVSLHQGGMTPREEKFYKKWPLQDLLIYQSKTPGRFLHQVSPGNKSFYSPFVTNPLAPGWGDIAQYRKGVENRVNINGAPLEPEYPPGSAEYGTVQGGLDYSYPLSLGSWNDYASCLSAMTPATMPGIPSDWRAGGNYRMNFGIPKMSLDFHIENQNEFLPAQFTVQVHEYRGTTGSEYASVRPDLNPINSIFDNANTTVPSYARSFKTTATAAVANSLAEPPDTVTYVNERSLLHNAPTFGNNSTHQRFWKIVASNKVRVTAGGRLKCSVTLDLPPFNALEWLYDQPLGTGSPAVRSRQLFVTILAQGTQEIYGDIYQDGEYSYSTNFMTNPVQYTVSNITKKAKLYAPNLQLQTSRTSGFDETNVVFGEFTTDLLTFGENKISQFVPEGQYDVPYMNIYDPDNIPALGTSLVIPVMSNQVKQSAGTKRA